MCVYLTGNSVLWVRKLKSGRRIEWLWDVRLNSQYRYLKLKRRDELVPPRLFKVN
jgi:hypothetical protein